MEQAGRPGVYVVTDNFIHDAKASVIEHGMPAMRIVTVPAKEYYIKRISKKEIETVVDKVIDNLINAVTKPLTKEELQVKAKKESVTKAINVTGKNYEEALEKFNQVFLENKWGDGLPLVPPTSERVKWMLRGTSRLPKEVIGKVLPKKGVLTVGKIAINAVMAGARPEYLPLIIAAMEALTDKDYDLLHIQTSTGSFSLAIVVSGPITKEIGVYSGIGVLGYGWRPNNTIGRAIRLCLINGGHVWPGENDMALVGRQSSHTFYTLAENHDYSPWEPYHVTQGFKPEDSCVSVFTVGGTVMSPYQKYGLSVYGGGSVRPWTVEQILVTIVNELKAAYRSDITKWRKATAIPSPPHLVLVVEPVFAMESERMKYTRKTLQEYIYKNATFPYEELTAEEVAAVKRRIEAGEIPQEHVNTFKEALQRGGKVPLLDSPNDIHIIVSGGIPSYTFGWTYFSKPIYAPNAHKTKLIRR